MKPKAEEKMLFETFGSSRNPAILFFMPWA